MVETLSLGYTDYRISLLAQGPDLFVGKGVQRKGWILEETKK